MSLVQLRSGLDTETDVPGGGVLTQVTVETVEFAAGTALTPQQALSRVLVNTAGLYQIVHAIQWDPALLATVQRRSMALVDGIPFETIALKANDALQIFEGSFTQYAMLQVGNVVSLGAQHDGVGNIEIDGARLTVLGPLT